MVGIPCHKLVLSLSSTYFASLFEKIPNQQSSHITYVVLPFSYHAVKTLVHYMYRGESRVSNDILKEVLHGGDMLKIRGLCHNDNNGKENKHTDQPKRSDGTVEIAKPAQPRANTPLNPFSTNVHDKVTSTNQSSKLLTTPSKPSCQIIQSPPAPSTTTTQVVKPPPKVQAKVVSRHAEVQETHQRPNINFLTIKEEPVEWTEQYEVEEVRDLRIKEEINELPATDSEYQKLSCEICRESFQMPAEWVRHVEHKHTELTLTIPKKRRKSEFIDEDENIASLRCDLCSTYFLTPAEWVKHVQSKHTEMELAMENEKLSLNSHSQGGNSNGSKLRAASYSGAKR